MRPTLAVLSKASRRPLTPKRGNKDFYKGTRAAQLPGGHRTGAPGAHVVRGKSKYRLIDEQVRFFLAPSQSDLAETQLRPYVATEVRLSSEEKNEPFGRRRKGPMTGKLYTELVEKLEEEPFT